MLRRHTRYNGITQEQEAGIRRQLWRAELHEVAGKPADADLCRQAAAWQRAFAEAKAGRVGLDDPKWLEVEAGYILFRDFWRMIRMMGFRTVEEANVTTDLKEPSDEELLK